jgi:hypothetical protein
MEWAVQRSAPFIETNSPHSFRFNDSGEHNMYKIELWYFFDSEPEEAVVLFELNRKTVIRKEYGTQDGDYFSCCFAFKNHDSISFLIGSNKKDRVKTTLIITKI